MKPAQSCTTQVDTTTEDDTVTVRFPNQEDVISRGLTEDVAMQVVDKFLSASRLRFGQEQLQSFNALINISLPHMFSSFRTWKCRFAKDELYVVVIRSYSITKPQMEESNGLVHNLSCHEAQIRDGNYEGHVYVWMDIWGFSRIDPRTKSQLGASNIQGRNMSKQKRVRVDIQENQCVHKLVRKKAKQKLGAGQLLDDDIRHEEYVLKRNFLEHEITENKQQTTSSLEDDPNYLAKLREAHTVCNLTPYEKETFKYLTMFEHHPRHRWMEMAVQKNSDACHSNDLIDHTKDELYSEAGYLVIGGRRKYMNRTPKLKHNWVFKNLSTSAKNYAKYVVIRSAHPFSRKSTSNTELWFTKASKFGTPVIKASLQYMRQQQKDIDLLIVFIAFGWRPGCMLSNALLYILQNFFEDGRVLPIQEIFKTLQYSLNPSNEILSMTQEDALVYIGRRTRTEESNQEHQENFTRQQEERDFESEFKDSETSSDPKDVGTKSAFIPHFSKPTSREELIRLGETALRKEVLPHIGYDKSNFDEKAMFIAYMVVQLVLFEMDILEKDNMNKQSNKRLQLCGEHAASAMAQQFNDHRQIAHKTFISALHNNHQMNLPTIYDHKRLSRSWRTAMATGVFKATIPAPLAGGAGGRGRSFGDAKQKPQKNTGKGKDKSGLCQIENSTNVLSMISGQLKETGTSMKQSGGGLTKEKRQMNGDWHVKCMAETPEGSGCGIQKQLALFAQVSSVQGADKMLSEYLIKNFDIIPLDRIIAEIKLFRNKACTSQSQCQCHMNITELSNGVERPVMVFNSGKWIGSISPQKVDTVCQQFRSVRYKLFDQAFPSLQQPKEQRLLNFNTDTGRVLYPLLRLDKLARLFASTSSVDSRPLWATMSLDMYLRDGFIDMMDKEEEEDILVALNPYELWRKSQAPFYYKFTHIEIMEILVMAASGSMIVGLEHNQGPRVLFSANMGKQALAKAVHNLCQRLDTMLNVLVYPMKSVVFSQTEDFLRISDIPSTSCVNIAVTTGNNTPEDANAWNMACVYRGFGRSIQYVTITVSEKKTGSMHNVERIAQPSRLTCSNMKPESYAHIDVDGLPNPGIYLKNNHPAIGRTRPIPRLSAGGETYLVTNPSESAMMPNEDRSVIVTQKKCGIVHRAYLASNANGLRIAKVQIRRTKRASEGDKFASSHSQKGCASEMVAPENMLISARGANMDGKFNPHGFTSRMTFGHYLEIFLGKAALSTYSRANGTAWLRRAYAKYLDLGAEYSDELLASGTCFGNPDLSESSDDEKVRIISEALHRRGWQRWGTERFYNTENGRLMGGDGKQGRGQIMSGPISYQTLVHMACNKLHHRAKGPRHWVTRQPIDGGEKDGGNKIGEMERDALFGSGCAYFAGERQGTASDPHISHSCTNCGAYSIVNMVDNHVYCPKCKTGKYVAKHLTCFSATIFMNTVPALGVMPRLGVSFVDIPDDQRPAPIQEEQEDEMEEPVYNPPLYQNTTPAIPPIVEETSIAEVETKTRVEKRKLAMGSKNSGEKPKRARKIQ